MGTNITFSPEKHLPWSPVPSNSLFADINGSLRRHSRRKTLSRPLLLKPTGAYAEQVRDFLQSSRDLTENDDNDLAAEPYSTIYPVIPFHQQGKLEIRIIRPGSSQQQPAPQDSTDNVPNGLPNGVATHAPHTTSREHHVPPEMLRPARVIGKKSLHNVLSTHNYKTRSSVNPRGLLNQHNMCFFNSVLQVLVHSEPFYALLVAIKDKTALKIRSETPILDGLVAFAAQYAIQPFGQSRIMSAESLYSTVCEHPKFTHMERGRQEDAQEFMSYLFDTLEENFDAAQPAEGEEIEFPSEEEEEEEADDGWTQIGRNNKPIVARESGRMNYDNPILEIFGGKLRSVLRKGNGAPSVTLDPFQQIPLDISNDNINTIQQALDHMSAVEKLQIEQNGRTIQATKQIEFDKVPPILVVYLKRFTFINRGDHFEFGKISKYITVDELNIPVSDRKVRYRPFAIIYHHGPSATVGHYTAEVLVDGVWYNIDDDYVYAQQSSSSSQAAYMVFYEQIQQ